MASSPRLDELEKRFNENPRRYFAPLANEYRKAGDIEHAIAICQAWLPQQPGHISGHIVYGQALFESGKLDEARGTFESALGLDPENLIALRYLGDISRQRGEVKSARGWYQRVLDADPRNEEIAGLIESLDGAGPTSQESAAAPLIDWGSVELQPGEAAPTTDRASTPVSTPAIDDASTLEIERASAETASSIDDRGRDAREEPLVLDIERASPTPESAPESAPSGGGFLDFALADFGKEMKSSPAPALSADTGDSLDFELEAMSPFEEGRVARAPDEAESALHIPELPEERELLLDEAAEAMQSEGAPSLEPPTATPPTAAGRSAGPGSASTVDIGLEPMEFVPPSREEQGAPLGVMEPDPFTGHLLGSSATPASPPPAAFVTETMAELYLQQGFLDDALTVYRQLLEQSPDDVALRERVEQLERGSRSSVSMAAISDEVIESARARAGAPVIRTIRSFLGSIAARRAPRASEPDPYAVPAMPDEGDARAAGVHAAEPPAGELGTFDLGLEPERPSGRAEREEALLGDVPLELAEARHSPPSIDFGEDVLLTAPAGMPSIAGSESPIPEEIPPAMLSAMAELTPAGGMGAQPAPPAVAPSEDDDIPRRAPSSFPDQPAPSLGGGTIDALFGRASSGSTEDPAAMTLARAFSSPSSSGKSAPLPGQPARTAKAELSLDQIFRDSPPPRGAPAGNASAFSFDQFFSQAEAAEDASRPPSGTSGGSTGAGATGGTSEADDIEQFNAWLEGLKKK